MYLLFLIAKSSLAVYIIPHIFYLFSIGEVTEWLKVHAWKACVREYREFESHPLRQLGFDFDSRVLSNRESRTPPDPEGSNGSDTLCVHR